MAARTPIKELTAVLRAAPEKIRGTLRHGHPIPTGFPPNPDGFPLGSVPTVSYVNGVVTWVYNARLTAFDIDYLSDTTIPVSFRVVATHVIRDTITPSLLTLGMWVHTLDDGLLWELTALSPATWEEVTFGGGGNHAPCWLPGMPWLDFWEDAQAAGSGPLQIVGNPDGSDRVIEPAGNYPLGKFHLIGCPTDSDDINFSPVSVTVSVADGVTFHDATLTTLVLRATDLAFVTDGPLVPEGTTLYFDFDNAGAYTSADFSAFPGVVAMKGYFKRGSFLTEFVGSSPLIAFAAHAQAAIFVTDSTNTFTRAFGGDNTVSLSVTTDNESYVLVQNGGNYSGTLAPSFLVMGAGNTAGAVDIDDGSGNRQHRRLALTDIDAGVSRQGHPSSGGIDGGSICVVDMLDDGTLAYTKAPASSEPEMVRSVVINGCGAAGGEILVVENRGQVVMVMHDGAADIAANDPVEVSNLTLGRVQAKSGGRTFAISLDDSAAGSERLIRVLW